MSQRWSTVAFVLTASLVSWPVAAQDVKVPLIEIGGNLSGLLTTFFQEDGPFMLLGGGPRVTVNALPRVGIELLGELMGPGESSGRTGIYLSQVKIPFRRSRSGGTLAFTVGALGLFSYQRFSETRRPRADGSIVVHPGFTRFRATVPNNLAFGITRDEALSKHVSGSLGVQMIVGPAAGLAIRMAGGIAFGSGGYR